MFSFACCTSITTTCAQPAARAASAVTSPIVPLPTTTPTSPGTIRALPAACIPTASGSTIAPSAKLTLSGSLKVRSAGCTTDGVRQPCTGGVAQKRTAGSRLYRPSRVAREFHRGMPGSMQTRSPGLAVPSRCGRFRRPRPRLVAQHHRLAHDERADRAVLIVVHVAAANRRLHASRRARRPRPVPWARRCHAASRDACSPGPVLSSSFSMLQRCRRALGLFRVVNNRTGRSGFVGISWSGRVTASMRPRLRSVQYALAMRQAIGDPERARATPSSAIAVWTG